jgi:hypothetical protein
MKLNNTLIYSLPEIKDDESNPVTVMILPAEAQPFITIDQDLFHITFYPNLWDYLKDWDLTIIIDDTNL